MARLESNWVSHSQTLSVDHTDLKKVLQGLSQTTVPFIWHFISGYYCNFRSSRPEVFSKKGLLRNFAKFSPAPYNFMKKRLEHRCFPVNFAKFLRASFSYNTCVGCFCISWQSEIVHFVIGIVVSITVCDNICKPLSVRVSGQLPPRKIALPPVKVRVCFRVRIIIRVGGNFPRGQLS